MKQLLVILISLFILPVYAQTGRITGKVTEKGSNLSVPFATVNVMLDDSVLRTDITSSYGYFQIDSLLNGNYVVEIAHVGFATRSRNISVKENFTVFIDFELKKNALVEDAKMSEIEKIRLTTSNDLTAEKEQMYTTGVVMELDNGEPIPFANVQLIQGKKQILVTTTDFDGKFMFINPIDTIYDILISYVGFKSVKTPSSIKVKGNRYDLIIHLPKGKGIRPLINVMYINPPFEKDNTTIETNFSRQDINRMAY